MTLRSSQGGEARVTLASPAHPASREAPEPDKQTHWGAILAMTLCGVVVAMNIGKVPIALSQLRGELGLTLVAAGWVVSMFNTLAMLAGVFFGMLGDRVGALRLCFLGLAVSFLGGLLGILSPGEELLLASRFLEGAGFIAVAVSAPALIIAATARQQLRFALGIWSTFVPAGDELGHAVRPSHSGCLRLARDVVAGAAAVACVHRRGLRLQGALPSA